MPRQRLIAWALVGVQGALIVAVVLLPRDPAWDASTATNVSTWILIGLGVGLGLWGARHLGSGLTPLPLPNNRIDMVTRGPYRWIRHPIYSGVILGVAGLAIRSRTPLVLGTAAVLTLFLAFKARWEEDRLRETFPGYGDYAARTGRFVPWIGLA